MTLKELMRLCYNAGREEAENKNYPHEHHAGSGGWGMWWQEYGEQRHDDFKDVIISDPDLIDEGDL